MIHIKRLNEMAIENATVDTTNTNQIEGREFIDFGGNTTVLWAKYALEINGEHEFKFNDVEDFNDNGWRLPTLKEIKQIFKPNTRWNAYWSIPYEIIKIKGEELRIRDEAPVGGGFHIWTKDTDRKFKHCAYSYGIDNSYEFCIYSSNKYERNYVFLVRDKR